MVSKQNNIQPVFLIIFSQKQSVLITRITSSKFMVNGSMLINYRLMQTTRPIIYYVSQIPTDCL